ASIFLPHIYQCSLHALFKSPRQGFNILWVSLYPIVPPCGGKIIIPQIERTSIYFKYHKIISIIRKCCKNTLDILNLLFLFYPAFGPCQDGLIRTVVGCLG